MIPIWSEEPRLGPRTETQEEFNERFQRIVDKLTKDLEKTMPHDRDGNVLEVGDFVNIPCVVKSIQPTENYCNVQLETVIGMPPNDDKNNYTLNTKQTVKIHK